jgi:mannosyl-3-phosphoglycerate phosphatase
MKIIYSDLDGTLLDSRTYSFIAAEPALSAIREQNLPLVFCTSKTRAEAEMWRNRMDNRHPFIVENGGAVYIPRDYFPFPLEQPTERGGYHAIEFGTPYLELVRTLREASRESGCAALGFYDMSVEDIGSRTLLPLAQAALAKMREYDEPFEILGSGTHTLLAAIERRGKQWTRGNRMYHITGASDKSVAVDFLTRLYRKAFGRVETIGVGDGHNDAKFLSKVDIPIVIRSRYAIALKLAAPRSKITDAPGPHGWNEAVLRLLSRCRPRPLVTCAAP